MSPVKCAYCGVAEWRHVCGGASGIGLSTTRKVVDTVVDASKGAAAVVDARARDRHRKTEERREYLRVKQRESRARRAKADVA